MKEELAVANPYRAIVACAAARRMGEQNRLLGLRRNPHPAARTMLLKVHFVDDWQQMYGQAHLATQSQSCSEPTQVAGACPTTDPTAHRAPGTVRLAGCDEIDSG